MPRRLRHTLQGTVFHVFNRGVRRATIFHTPDDYKAFLEVVREGLSRFPRVGVIAYCVMPNHWHFVMTCDRIEHLSHLMHWTTGTHVQRWHARHGTRGTGSLYQGRFTALPVQTETYLLRVCRYVERNPLRAQLVTDASDWPWSSLVGPRNLCEPISLAPWPILRPSNWIGIVNRPETAGEVDAIRQMTRRSQPLGEPAWQHAVAPFCGLSMKPIGRPKKDPRPL